MYHWLTVLVITSTLLLKLACAIGTVWLVPCWNFFFIFLLIIVLVVGSRCWFRYQWSSRFPHHWIRGFYWGSMPRFNSCMHCAALLIILKKKKVLFVERNTSLLPIKKKQNCVLCVSKNCVCIGNLIFPCSHCEGPERAFSITINGGAEEVWVAAGSVPRAIQLKPRVVFPVFCMHSKCL